MLDDSMRAQLRDYLTLLRHDIELVAHLDDSALATQTRELLDQIASLSDRVTVVTLETAERDDVVRRPSFTVRRAGDDSHRVMFAGLPMGHEFTSLVLALLHVGGHPAKVAQPLLDRITALREPLVFETFYSQSCQNCPDVVQALNLMAALNPSIHHVAVDGSPFADEAEARGVLAVPAVFLNGVEFSSGRAGLEDLLDLLDGGGASTTQLDDLEPFDVLVVGGGPAGAAAAVYAARKGIRTGLLTDKIGGQVLDTMSIENLVSVLHTEGPQLARALDAHVRAYDVEVLTGQRATRLSTSSDGLVEVTASSGATLRSRSVVLAPGASWRTMGVPGEDTYRNKGVTFCPHCDGPLFKGKDVAVIGGGNSGVEAAIDLAGIARHVTVVEYLDELRADAVLQDALTRLPNVDVVTLASVTDVVGDGRSVTGLRYTDRSTDTEQELSVSGVFVQIGLNPATSWLQGSVDLNERGEIVIDAKGATSLPGVFAAGDATTAPFKQIVVAVGAGATAALSAFDHLVRNPVAVGV